MVSKSTSGAEGTNGELFIHLDLNGLAALMAAVQTAMDRGRAQLECGASGLTARTGSGALATVIVTFARPADDDDDLPARADPAPHRLLEPAE